MDEAGSRPLAAKRVVVTRPAEQSAPLITALTRAGAEPIILPLIRIVPPENVAALDAVLMEIGSFDWILFTSQNAVKAVTSRARILDRSLRDLASKAQIGVVGQGTKREAEAAGFSVTHVASRPLGRSLVKDLAAGLRSKRVFLPRSDKADPDLVRLLHSTGAALAEVVAYRTVPEDPPEANLRTRVETADALLFFSPSAVEAFIQNLGCSVLQAVAGRGGAIAVIGPVTRLALARNGVEASVKAADASVAGIVTALADFFRLTQVNSSGAKSA